MTTGTNQDDPYRGPLGATRRARLHVACPCGAHHSVEVVVAIDCQADPALAGRLLQGEPLASMACPVSPARRPVSVPILYHDPDRRLFALVLGEADRWRDLAERARLYGELAADTAHPVPRYVVEFQVVYGPEGLRRLLDGRAPVAAGARDPVRRERPAAAPSTESFPRSSSEEIVTGEIVALTAGSEAREASPGGPSLAAAAPGDLASGWPGGRDPILRRVGPDGLAQLLVRAGRGELELFAAEGLEVRVQLYRMASHPLVTLGFALPGGFSGQAGGPFWVPLDIGSEGDRGLLAALGRSFELSLEIFDREEGRRVMVRRIRAPLAENARCALTAASDSLKRIPVVERSFSRAVAAFLAPDCDRLGKSSPLFAVLDEAALDVLDRPADVARATRMVRRFSEPAGEDWLILTRGYPMERWQRQRRSAVERAVELGLWPGPVAAQIAVSAGTARSRKELVVRLQRNFANLLAASEHGLDHRVVSDNWRALEAEAAALGFTAAEWATPRSEPIVSELEPVASGTIGGNVRTLLSGAAREPGARSRNGRGAAGPAGRDAAARPADADPRVAGLDDAGLRALLAQRDRRMFAAIELCRRGDPAAVGPVFAAIESMSRAEAGRVLARVNEFGRQAEKALVAGLAGRKSYLRQGAALALAVQKSEAGLEAICDLVLDEPTEIWREVARALGEVGEAAVMPLVARLARRPDEVHERAAWALAHIAARGARRPVETLAAGRDAIAAGVARQALELTELARSDNLEVRGEKAPRDQTVNRAFSRQFFSALAAEERASGAPALAASGTDPAMLLDESDVLEAVDVSGEEAELDEGDLLPT
jgi:hypothetical protein